MNSIPRFTKSAFALLLLALAVCVLVAVLPYAAGYGQHRRTLFQILTRHWGDATWQHGALAFPIVGFLIWRMRGTLAQIPVQPSAMGVGLMFFSGLVYFAGYKAHLFYLGFGSIQIFLAGACIWLWGWQQAKACVFPWLMLTFAWPLLFLEESLAFHLRLLMVACAGGVLDFLGVDVIREGTALVSAPNTTSGLEAGAIFRMNIDAPCSGLRSLFALMMVSAVYAWSRQKVVWRRWLLFFCSLPLAVVANMARIFLLIGASALFGQEFAVGDEQKEVSTFHFLSGMVVFVIALAGLEALSLLLSRVFDRQKAATTRTQNLRATVVPRHP
jgi:exosortase